MRIKSWLKNIGVVVVKNWWDLSGHGTLKSADTNLEKLEVTVVIFGGTCSKLDMAF